MLDKDSVAQYNFELDKNGYIVRETFLNRNFERISNGYGLYYITFKRERDNTANYVEMCFYDKNEKLFDNGAGYAISRSKYDKLTDNFLEGTYYGLNREIKKTRENAAQKRCKYNKIGCCVEFAYYGIDGKLTNSKDSFSIARQEFDKLGRITEQRSYGTDQKLCELKWSESAISKYQYNSKGNISKISYFGKDGFLKNSKMGAAICTNRYDSKNRRIEETLYDVNNKLIMSDSGCETRWKYDDKDNIIEESHWGANGQLKEDKNKYAIIRWEYDSMGEVKKIRYYDSHENLLSEH
jgi:hypothetical protein